MILETQTDVIAALADPKTYGASKVQIRQSHIAILFLAGQKAYKLKRAVLYPDVDFSTPEKRRLACVWEMKRSAVYAPQLRLKIQSVRRLADGTIVIGGRAGVEVDTLLEMKRIPDRELLNRLLPSPRFDRFEAMTLAEKIAQFHMTAKVCKSQWGAETIQRIILENESVLSCFGDLFNKTAVNALARKSLDVLKAQASLISYRQKTGHVRKCHGDLLLSNIAWDGKDFAFFSPIEYNDTLSCVDTLYDMADLMMDLEAKGLRRLTNMLFNHYMAYMNDMNGFPLLALYQSIRAASRAAVCAKKSTFMRGAEKRQMRHNARVYFDLARHFMTPFKPILICCGGLSGSGKSRIAREIGGLMNPAPGAVILRDDIIKKQMVGLAPHEPFDVRHDTPAFEAVVYEALRQQAKTAIANYSCVIIDALFIKQAERAETEKLAKDMGVPFVGIWAHAPLDIRNERIHNRKRNPSDVSKKRQLERQLKEQIGPVAWKKISTDVSREQTLRRVVRLLKKQLKIVKRKMVLK
ncbi:MAG: AAA family ATPase [Alphaproteobacteria bacterium]|nr:AAA family ATPase [Alphaproteobacteria bacterium]